MKYSLFLIFTLLFMISCDSDVSRRNQELAASNKQLFKASCDQMELYGDFDLPENDEFWASLSKKDINDFLTNIKKKLPERSHYKNLNHEKEVIKEMISKMLVYKGPENKAIRDSIYTTYAVDYEFVRVCN